MSGQSIMDRVTAAKHSIAGSGLAKSICKATTEEISGPKKKHIDYLLQCTNEPNVSIPQMADLLIERTQDKNWTIVFKALITVHNLMNNGNERFSQYLASNNCRFNLGTFLDKSGVQDKMGGQGYDMSTFIRRYSNYINAKCDSYRAMAFDFCKVKRGKEDGLLRTMSGEKLLKTLPVLQAQVDGLLEFDCSPNELTNGVINASFVLMFKDLIRLFACYNDGIINLLEKYFEMNKKQCKEALDIYKKFLVRMDKVAEFLKVAENVGIDKGEIPDLAKAPASLLEALEQHLSSLEGKKAAKVPTPTQTPANVASAISTYAVQSNSKSATPITDEEKRRVLQEEEKRLEQLKEQRAKEAQASPAPAAAAPAPVTAPVAAPATTQPDLFNAPQQNNTASKASDDLLGLNENAFDAKIANVLQLNQQVQQSNQQQAMFGMGQPVASNNPFGAPAMGVGAGQPQVATSSSSAFDANFAAAFGSSAPSTGAPGAGGLAGMAPMQPAATPQTEGDKGDVKGTTPSPTPGAKSNEPSLFDTEDMTLTATMATGQPAAVEMSFDPPAVPPAQNDPFAPSGDLPISGTDQEVTAAFENDFVPTTTSKPTPTQPKTTTPTSKETVPPAKETTTSTTTVQHNTPSEPAQNETDVQCEAPIPISVTILAPSPVPPEATSEEQTQDSIIDTSSDVTVKSMQATEETMTTAPVISPTPAVLQPSPSPSPTPSPTKQLTPSVAAQPVTPQHKPASAVDDLLGMDLSGTATTDTTEPPQTQSEAIDIPKVQPDSQTSLMGSSPEMMGFQGMQQQQQGQFGMMGSSPGGTMMMGQVPMMQQQMMPGMGMMGTSPGSMMMMGGYGNMMQQGMQQQAVNPADQPKRVLTRGEKPKPRNALDALDIGMCSAFITGSPKKGGSTTGSPAHSGASDTSFDGFGDVLQPSNKVAEKPKDQKLLTGDVDSSLSSLVGNLNVNGSGYQVKKQEMQWKPQGEKRMTGGQNFGQQGLAPQTMAPQQPAGAGWGQPQQQAPPMGFQPMGGMQPAGGMGMQPGMGMQQQQFMAGGMRPMGAGMGMQQQPMGNFQPRQQTPNDPFGAL